MEGKLSDQTMRDLAEFGAFGVQVPVEFGVFLLAMQRSLFSGQNFLGQQIITT